MARYTEHGGLPVSTTPWHPWVLAALVAMAACRGPAAAPAAPAAPREAPPAAQPPAVQVPTSRHGLTHHGLLVGTVVDAAGAPLDSVEVVTWTFAEPWRGSMPRNFGLTDRTGAFSVPVRVMLGATAPRDTASFAIVVRTSARRLRASGGPQFDSAIVSVRVGPLTPPPPTARARIVMSGPR
jgi:hypothetical protein